MEINNIDVAAARNRMVTRYVLGFCFNDNTQRVALIRKLTPDFQANKLNGIGGKIEAGETPVEAIAREFGEETGVRIFPRHWLPFCTFSGAHHEVHCFYTIAPSEFKMRVGNSGEVPDWYHVTPLNPSVMPNLHWLLPMALTFARSQESISYQIIQ